jgi:hypothetical protein
MENYFAAAVIFGLFVLIAATSAERKDIRFDEVLRSQPRRMAGAAARQRIDCRGQSSVTIACDEKQNLA